MGSPIFNAMGGGNMGGGPMQMMQRFRQFMQSMQGKDPKQEVDNMIRSGRINQQQLNQAQQMASQMQGMFSGFFGK